MQEITITRGLNGYPKGLHKGFVGFDTFEDAKNFAKEHGGKVVELTRRDGWQFYVSGGAALTPFDMYTILSRENGQIYTNDIDEGEFINEEIFDAFNGSVKDFDELQSIVDRKRELFDAIKDCEDDEFIYYHDCIIEKYKRSQMSYYEDVWHNEIGVEM